MAPSPIFNEFREWLKKHERTGSRFGDSSTSDWFIPFSSLQSFWSHDNLQRILDAASINCLTPDSIHPSYLRVLSVLTYITNPFDAERPRHNFTIPLQYLERFVEHAHNDFKLPIDRQEDKFGGDKEVLNKFLECQHHFNVASLQPGHCSNRSLSPLEILPITRIGTIAGGDKDSGYGAHLHKYKLEDGHDLQDPPLDGVIVVKVFTSEDIEYNYARECDAFIALKNYGHGHDQFLKCYGTLRQNNRAVILLEYANGGSLRSFFKENNLPNTAPEYRQFWRAMAQLLSGLSNWHDLGRGDGRVSGVHQDIKPSNIFVFREKDDPYSSTLRFKLGDFDLSAIGRGDLLTLDNHSTKAYGAPELMPPDHHFDHQSQEVTSSADMWSIGCVLLEAAIWSILGERGLVHFEKSRCAETTDYQRKAGYAACFHDGDGTLKAVHNAKNQTELSCRAFDTFTLKITNYVLEHLLLPRHDAKSRAHAQNASTIIRRIADEIGVDHWAALPSQPPLARSHHSDSNMFLAQGVTSPTAETEPFSLIANEYVRLPVQNPPTPQTAAPPVIMHNGKALVDQYAPGSGSSNCTDIGITGTHGSPSTAPSTPSPTPHRPPSMRSSLSVRGRRFREVTVERVLEWKRTKDKKREPDSLMEAFINAVESQLRGRDQIFLIDNSITMKDHWPRLKQTFQALATIVKRFDRDGMELRLTSDPSKHYSGRDMKNLLDRLDKHEPRNGEYGMEMTLDMVTEAIIKRGRADSSGFAKALGYLSARLGTQGPTGASVYILTDGIWGESKLSAEGDENRYCGVDKAIQAFIRNLQKSGLGRTYASIQFVGFGRDHVGWTRLSYLDDQLRHVAPKGWDIVDAKPHEFPLFPLLIGSLDPKEDG